MVKKKNYKEGCEFLNVTNIRKEGEYIICERDGFEFKISRQNWPPQYLQIRHAIDRENYFKFLVIKKHGDLFDLSETKFKTSEGNVVASCKFHGRFEMKARFFIEKDGCPKCGRERSAKSKYLTNDEFIQRAKDKHGERYKYDFTEYKGYEYDVIVTCRQHGNFKINADTHIHRSGCPICAKITMQRLFKKPKKKALDDLIRVHGDKYNYDMFNYSYDSSKIIIKCKEHGIFEQAYSNHLQGQGCPSCAREFNPVTRTGFINSSIKRSFASLYLLNCYSETECFYKIGITSKQINQRFSTSKSMPYNFELLHLYISDGESIWNLEKLLHKEYRDVRYLPTIKFGGMYECFSEINVDEYKKLLQIIG